MSPSNYYNATKRNIRRTPYQAMAASMIMFLTFLALSLFLILGVGLQQVLRFYESKPQIIAFFKDNTTETDIKAISEALNQTGKVTNMKYVSKEDAFRIYKERNKNDPRLLELVTASFLPTSLEISTNSPSDLQPIVEIVKKEPVVDDVLFPQDVVEQLTQTTKLIRVVGASVVGFLMAFSILIIIMITGFKIRIKRQEIETMKLLGASNGFVRAPFIMEGIFYAALGAFLAWVLSYLQLWYFEPFIKTYLGESAKVVLPVSPVFMLGVLGIEMLLAVLIGSFGSFWAVRRYLHLE